MLRPFLLSAALVLPGPAFSASIVTDWLDVAIPAANLATSEPTAAARFFNILFTAMYDAWSAYDDQAVATDTGHGPDRRTGPPRDGTPDGAGPQGMEPPVRRPRHRTV